MPAVDPMPVQEHPEFFFPDGNVVFLSRSPPVAFKLHRGIVNRWSPQFHRMLAALDASAHDALTFKGTAAVELDDGSVDLERLVCVLYDGTSASLPTTCTAATFPHLASVLLLSHKYGIAPLFAHARGTLLAAYPLTLAAWDARDAYAFTPAARRARRAALRRHAPPLAVVSLALQLNAPHLLRGAYLDLARRPASEITRGLAVAAAGAVAAHPAGVTLHLRPRQTAAVLRGKEALQRFVADFIRADVEARGPAPQCRYLGVESAAPTPCAAAFAAVAREMLVMTADITCGVDSDPLFVLRCALELLGRDDGGGEGDGESERGGHGACTACVDWFRQSVYVARQHVWACVDKWFDLDKVLEGGFDAGGWE